MQIAAPDAPNVAAFRFMIDHIHAFGLYQIHKLTIRLIEKVLFAAPYPEQTESGIQPLGFFKNLFELRFRIHEGPPDSSTVAQYIVEQLRVAEPD